MRAAQASRAAARAKTLNLSVDTNVNNTNSGSVTVTQAPDVSAEVMTAPPSRLRFDTTGTESKSSRPSQALANPNWRNRHLGPGAPLNAPITAGLPQTELQRTRGRASKQASRPTSPVNEYPIRGYRESPVDPDFIHSAPLTKRDFQGAETDSNGSQRDKGNDVYSWDRSDEDKLGVQSLINLEPLSPDAKESYGAHNLGLKLEKENGQWVQKWSYGNCPLSAIPVTTAEYSSLAAPMIFPTAEVQSIKQSRRFQASSWDDIDKDVRREVAKLQDSVAVTHPLNRLPKEHNADRQLLPINSTFQRSSAQTIKIQDKRYENLIQKLNTPTQFYFTEERHAEERRAEERQAERRQIREELRSIGRRLKNEGSEESDDIKPLSLTHLPASYSRAKQPGKSLNPLAMEFQFSSPIANDVSGPSKAIHHGFPSPVAKDAIKNQGIAGNNVQAILELIGCLRDEIAELKASAIYPSHGKDASLQQQIDHLQNMANDMGAGPNLPTHSPQNDAQMALVHVPQPSLEAHHDATQQGPQQGVQQGTQQYGGYTQPQASMTPYPSMAQNHSYMYGTYDGTIINGSVANPAAFNGMPNYTGAAYYASAYAPHVAMAPVYGFNGQPITQFGMIPNPNPTAAAGPLGYGDIPLHQQAQIAFGPKPVTKPRGPPRIGDPNFAKHQQEYEQYLETLRASNPEYARQCKDRQAKRNERQRSSRS